MWRIWTRGWGPRAWWFWFKREGLPLWIAFALPRRIAYWTFIRVVASTGQNPDQITYKSACDAWEAGAGR